MMPTAENGGSPNDGHAEPLGNSDAPPPSGRFRHEIVYPYHYRNGDETKADIEQLKKLVGEGVDIRVMQRYPEK